jgi:O-antigen ligase/polysaccharide polymerase Wzy-like membrane protein
MPKASRLSDWLWSAFGFALMTAYWPGISGVATTPRWDVAALLALALFFAPRIKITEAHVFGGMLIACLSLSLLWNDGGTDGRLDGCEALFELVIAAIAFTVGSTIYNIRPLVVGAAIGIGLNSIFAIAQWMGWHSDLFQALDHTSAGLFYNRDRLAAAAAMVAVGLVALPRLWVWLPLLLPSLILTHSRAAWIAVAVGIAVTIWENISLRALAILSAIGAGMVFLVLWHGVDPAGMERLVIWHDTMDNLTFWGHGLGSFREVFLKTSHFYDISYWQSRPEHPHNEWLWLAFEGGVPAFGLGLLFAVTVWLMAEEPRQRGILACLFVLSLFAMPLHDPATLVLGALCAGHMSGFRDYLRNVAIARGMALRPWLAAYGDQRKHEPSEHFPEGLPVPAAVSRGHGEASADLRSHG